MAYHHLSSENAYLKRHKKRKLWRRTAFVFSLLIAFCTIYMLIIPAITMQTEEKYTCNVKEHVHNETCYAKDQVLICEQTEHTHAPSCLLQSEAEKGTSLEDSMKTAVAEWETLLADKLAGEWGRVRLALGLEHSNPVQEDMTVSEENAEQNATQKTEQNDSTGAIQTVTGETGDSDSAEVQGTAETELSVQENTQETGIDSLVDTSQTLPQAGETSSAEAESSGGQEASASDEEKTAEGGIDAENSEGMQLNDSTPQTDAETSNQAGASVQAGNNIVSNPTQKPGLAEVFKGLGIYEDAAANYMPQTGDFVLIEAEQQGQETMAVVASADYGGTTIATGDRNGKVVELHAPKITGYGNLQKARTLFGNPAENKNENDALPNVTEPGADTEEPEENKKPPTDQLKDYIIQHSDLEYPDDEDKPVFKVDVYDKNDILVSPENDKYSLTQGESYRLHFIAYAPDGIPYEGQYYYELPRGLEVFDFGGRNIQANDGDIIGRVELSGETEGKQYIVADMIANNKIRVKIEFDVNVKIGDEVNSIEGVEVEVIAPGIQEKGTIEKQGKLEVREDGMYAVWTIIADIPGCNPNAEPKEWHICDMELILGGPLEYVDWRDKEELEIIFFDGKEEYELEDYSKSDKKVAYYVDESSAEHDLYLVNSEQHDNCAGKINGTKYCKHWIHERDSQVTLCYTTKLPGTWDWDNNTACLYQGQDSPQYAEARINSPKNENIILKEGNGDGEYTVSFNTEKIDLSKFDVLTLTDEMTGTLHYEKGSMKITAEDTNGVSRPLQYDREYMVEVSDQAQKLKITLKNPGACKYTLTYNTVTDTVPEVSGDNKNTISVKLGGEVFQAIETVSNTEAEEFYIKARKSQKGTTPAVPVEGAAYALFSSTGELKTSGITDEDGNISFEGNAAEGFGLRDEKLYYIQETEAPDGYFLDDTKYWFYIEKEEGAKTTEETGDAKPAEDEEIPPYVEKELRDAKYNGLCDENVTPLVVKNGQDANSVTPIAVSDEKIFYLPKTGSSGLIVYTAAGCLLIMTAACILYNRKREVIRKERNK